MSVYDPKLQQDLADLLSLRAKRIAPVFTAMAAIIGSGVGLTIARSMGKQEVVSVALWAFVIGIFGFVAGKERAFSLRMKAQELLCQKQIEANTRAVEVPLVNKVSA